MAAKTWSVSDAASNQQALRGDQQWSVPGAEGLRVTRDTLRGGVSDGVDVLTVTNGDLQVRVVPTRGMSLWDMHYRGERLGWTSPVRGPVHPAWVDLGEPSGLGWLDGFNELLVRCGLESNGAPEFAENGRLLYPLHGRIGNRPAHKIDVSIDAETQTITVVGVVEETRFHFLKLRLTSTLTLRAGEKGIGLRDEIMNLSQSPAEMQMLYHINFGEPLLDAGSRVLAPVKTVIPRNTHAAAGIDNWASYIAPQAGFEEHVYFFELLADAAGRTPVVLKNAHGTRGARVTYSQRQLPCFTVWKNTTALADGYVTGIEPGTNFPNPRSFEGEQGRVVKLDAGGSTAFDLRLDYLSNDAEVQAAAAEIAAIQAETQPLLHREPQAGWCAP